MGTPTHLAVEEILAQALTDSAQAALGAVVDGLVRVVVPELADVAVVVGGRTAAPDARVRGALGAAAEHAEHVLRLLPRQDVVLDGVVAETARVPPLAAGALQLDVAPVVLASEGPFVGFRAIRPLVCRDPFRRTFGKRAARRIGGLEIILRQREVERPIAVVVPKPECLQRPCRFRGL